MLTPVGAHPLLLPSTLKPTYILNTANDDLGLNQLIYTEVHIHWILQITSLASISWSTLKPTYIEQFKSPAWPQSVDLYWNWHTLNVEHYKWRNWPQSADLHWNVHVYTLNNAGDLGLNQLIYGACTCCIHWTMQVTTLASISWSTLKPTCCIHWTMQVTTLASISWSTVHTHVVYIEQCRWHPWTQSADLQCMHMLYTLNNAGDHLGLNQLIYSAYTCTHTLTAKVCPTFESIIDSSHAQGPLAIVFHLTYKYINILP